MKTRNHTGYLLPHIIVILTCALFLCLLSIEPSQAGSATWKLFPVSGNWNDAANWSTGGPPNGTADTATFKTSGITNIFFSAFTTVDGIVFRPGASAYTITTSTAGGLTLDGVGINNSSGTTQTFATDTASEGGFTFSNSASAGSSTTFALNTVTAGGFGGFIEFTNTSSGGSALINVNGTNVAGGFGSFVEFSGTSTCSNATFVIDSGTSGAGSGFMNFFETSTAQDATFTCNGRTDGPGGFGGILNFFQTSNAGAATIIVNGGANGGLGGSVGFAGDSTSTTARVELFGNGQMDNSNRAGTPVTIGSLEGDGLAFLGGFNLTVGTNNLSTTFSGVISDGGGSGGVGASLTKTGTGTLTLAGANTYTGGTTVNSGALLVQRSSGSGTGTGSVVATAGTLGGNGRISGAVTLGNNSGARAFLAPGLGTIGTLTVQKKVSYRSDSTYNFELNSNTATADRVNAKGVAIAGGALFAFTDLGTGTLTSGTVFTVISNTAATPISGAFSNLVDGSTFTDGNNTYQASYSGGTGNDLTLTVQ